MSESQYPQLPQQFEIEEGVTDPGFVVETDQEDLFPYDDFEKAPATYKPVKLQEDDALDVVGTGRALKGQKLKEAEMRARDFGMQLNKMLLEGTELKNGQYQEVRDYISRLGQTLYQELSGGKPAIQKLSSGVLEIIAGIYENFAVNLNLTEDELTEKMHQAFHLIWVKPIEPYILNYLLRSSSIKSLDLLRVWKDSVQARVKPPLDEDPHQVTFLKHASRKNNLTEEEIGLWKGLKEEEERIREEEFAEAVAIEQLKQYALKANKFAALFSHNGGGNYFCSEILDTNDIRELQKIVAEETGFSQESWEKKHHAYIKISLMYAILMVDGKLQPKKIEYISNRLWEKIKTICFRYGKDPETNEPIYILNPKRNQDGTLSESEDSILINGIHINTKHDFSLLLKFIMKVLSDSIAPSIDNIRDLIRGRIMMLEDARKSHPSYRDFTKKEAEIAAATKILAILMGVTGTSVDKRNIRLSIEDGDPISTNGTGNRVRRALQIKTFPMFDTDEEGNISSAGQTYPVEWQVICYIPTDAHQADIDEYIQKKTFATEMQLGVVTFQEYFLDICEVFINQYGFPNHDTSEQRKLREQAFGPKSRQKPLMQEIVAAKIVEGILADTPKTHESIKEMLSDPIARKIIEDAMDKIGAGMYPWTFYHLQSQISEFIDICIKEFGNNSDYVQTFNQILEKMRQGYQSPAVFTEIVKKLKDIQSSFALNVQDLYPNNPQKASELTFHLEGLVYIFETGPDKILERYNLAKKRVRKLCSQIDSESAKCQNCPAPEV